MMIRSSKISRVIKKLSFSIVSSTICNMFNMKMLMLKVMKFVVCWIASLSCWPLYKNSYIYSPFSHIWYLKQSKKKVLSIIFSTKKTKDDHSTNHSCWHFLFLLISFVRIKGSFSSTSNCFSDSHSCSLHISGYRGEWKKYRWKNLV